MLPSGPWTISLFEPTVCPAGSANSPLTAGAAEAEDAIAADPINPTAALTNRARTGAV
jgi:hypothetical protein